MSYVCSNNPSHKYPTKPGADGSDPCCPICGWDGLLIEESDAVAGDAREIGLAILLMDASGSMRASAFPIQEDTNPPTRVDCVVRSAAQ